MVSRAEGGGGRGPRQFDATFIAEAIEALSTRAVGRTIAVAEHDIVATIVSVELVASDYSLGTAVTSGIETSLTTLGEVNEAAMKGVDDSNPMKTGMRIFDALARGVDRAIEASPLNPLHGTIAVLESGSGEFSDVQRGRWHVSDVEVSSGPVALAVEPGRSTLRMTGVELRASLSDSDVRTIIDELGYDLGGDLVVTGDEVLVRKRIGPFSIDVPLEFDINRDELTVTANTARLGRRRVRLPARFARSHMIDVSAIVSSVVLQSLTIRGSRIHIGLAAEDVEEPVTVQQVRDLVTKLRGSGELDVERLS